MARIRFVKYGKGKEKHGAAPLSSGDEKISSAMAGHSSDLQGSGKAICCGAMPGNAEELHGYVRRRHSVEKLSTDKREQWHGFGKLGTAQQEYVIRR